MASAGTSSPSAADTFLYLMRDPVRESSWLKLTVLRDTAAYSLIGMLTSPKLIDPLQMALGIRGSIPDLSADEQGDSGGTARTHGSHRWSGHGDGRAGGLLGRRRRAATPTTTTAPPGPAVGLDEIQVLAAHNAYHLEGEEALLAGHHREPPRAHADHRVLAPHAHRAARPRPAVLRARPVRGPRRRSLRRPEGPVAPRPGADRPRDAGAGLQGVPHPGGRLPLHLPHLRARASTELEAWSRTTPRATCRSCPPRGQGRRDPRPAQPRLRAADPRDRGHVHRRRGGDPLACSTTSSWSRWPTCRATPTRSAPPSRTRAGPTSTTSAAGSCSCSTTTSAKRDLYRAVHPDTLDRLIFVDAQPPDDDAAFTVLNDPVADGDRIRELVDAWATSCAPAPTPTPSRRAAATPPAGRRPSPAAPRSSAPTTSVEDPRLPGFVTELPGDGPARCNPVSAPDDCDDAAVRRRLRLRRRRRP